MTLTQELTDALHKLTIAQTKAATDEKVVVAKVERFGTSIVIPEGMTMADAEQVIRRAREADEMVVKLSDDMECFIWEGCYALKLALEELYGWVDIQPTSGWWGKEPPAFVQVEINADGDTCQVPWGKFFVPSIPKGDGHVESSYNKNNVGRFIFSLHGELKQKWAPEFHRLAACVRKHLREHSIYKGTAISIRFKDDDGDYFRMPKPTFIKLDRVSETGLVFPDEVETSIHTNLFTPVEQTEAVRDAGIPLKRGVLLAGDYGTGKTLAAYVTAKKAVNHGHTFIYCENINEFSDVMKFAQLYAHSGKIAIVFCEDIDKVLQGDRNISMDQILNIMDGVDAKRHEILTIFTTNEVEEIHQAAIRPGRLDAVIHVQRPDADAVVRLIRLYAGSRVKDTEDLSGVGAELAGNIPAVIRECVERAKLYQIGMNKQAAELSSEAILASAQTMKMQLELLEKKEEEVPDDMEIFGRSLGRQIVSSVRENLDEYPAVRDYMLTENGKS